MSAAVQIVMLTDEQLAAEIVETRGEVCCASGQAASIASCGCGGRAADYLRRLLAESHARGRAA